MRKSILIGFLLIASHLIAQVQGTITDSNQQPLSFVSVYLENTVTGTTSNDQGTYVLALKKPGNYVLVFQFLGYKTVKREVSIASFPYQLDIVLEEESVQLQGISISTKDNPANKIIRNVIANKEKNTDKFSQYTAQFYSRGLYKIKDAPEKFLGQTLGDFGGGLDSTRSGIIYLSETFSEIKYQKKPKRFQENIIASKVSGRDNGVSFNRAEDASINFYENSIDFGNELVSPISFNAFGYYTFKLIGTFFDKNGRLINKIKIIPKRKNDHVFAGFIYIVENDWAIYGVDVTVTGVQINIPVVDELHLKQDYNYSDAQDAWVLISQSIDFKVNVFGFKVDGRFSSAYSAYNFTPNFNNQSFSNEVLSFEKQATEKDTLYWNQLRPVPLTFEEVKDYQIKDSIKLRRASKIYQDSLDKKRNQLSWLSPIRGYSYRNSYQKKYFFYDGPLLRTGYNTVQGINTSIEMRTFKEINKKGKWRNAGMVMNYGFSEKRLRPTFYYQKKWNNFSRPTFTLSAGITTPQFNEREPIRKLNNTARSLFARNNFMKIFEKTFAKIAYSEEVINGIYLKSSLEYAERKPLYNTSNFSLASSDKNGGFTSNNPLAPRDFITPAFTKHEIATLKVEATFVFNQKYASYPNQKIVMENNQFPTVNISYTKRFGASNNALNSDLFLADVKQDINLGNYGLAKYTFRGGAFLKQKQIAFMDYLQANGNQLTFPLDKKLTNFDLLNYYQYFSNNRYAEAHVEHNFKGFLMGKIPLLKHLNVHFVAGAKTLIMADNKPYSEISAGLDNIGFGKWKLFRVYYAKSFYGGVQNNGVFLQLNLLK